MTKKTSGLGKNALSENALTVRGPDWLAWRDGRGSW